MYKKLIFFFFLVFTFFFFGLTAKAESILLIIRSGGWFETAYVEWAFEGTDAFNVYIKLPERRTPFFNSSILN
ncbi:MAG TPA: hypothetical protein VIK96_02305 [Bacilli bacterium]